MNKVFLMYENNRVIVSPYLILVARFQHGPFRAVSVCLGGTVEAEVDSVEADSVEAVDDYEMR
jgi:hypothetical protein